MDLVFIAKEGFTPVNTAALAADVVLAFVPVATGGGLAIRGGKLAIEGAIRIPAVIRAGQAVEKIGQAFMASTDPTGKRPNWRKGYSKQDFIDNLGDICPYCGEKMTKADLSRDHISPWKSIKELLGKRAEEIDVYHDWDNLTGACRSCNSKKGAKSLLKFLYDKLQGK